MSFWDVVFALADLTGVVRCSVLTTDPSLQNPWHHLPAAQGYTSEHVAVAVLDHTQEAERLSHFPLLSRWWLGLSLAW